MQVTQEILWEFSRLGIVFVHLITCCIAIGLVLTSDVVMLRQLFKGAHSEHSNSRHLKYMKELKSIVSMALVALWVTGFAVIALDVSVKGFGYFANPKIQAKILVVALLTVNGALLHHHVLPWMQKAGSLLQLTFKQSLMATFAGVVSGVSWLYAAMLGVGRPLSWKYSLLEIMAAYPLMIVGGFVTMLLITAWTKNRVLESRISALSHEVEMDPVGSPGNNATYFADTLPFDGSAYQLAPAAQRTSHVIPMQQSIPPRTRYKR